MKSCEEKGRKEVTGQRKGGRKAGWEKIFKKGSIESQIRKQEQPRERKCWRKRRRKRKEMIEGRTQKCSCVIKRCDYGGRKKREFYLGERVPKSSC